MGNEKASDAEAKDAHAPPTASFASEVESLTGKAATAKSRRQTNPAKEQLDRDLVRWTRILAFFTGGLVVAAALQFWAMRAQLSEMETTREGNDRALSDQMAVMSAQAKTMQGQLDQMDIAQRPWLRLSNFTPIRLTVGNAGVSITVDLHAANVGHSPAQRAYVRGKIFPSMSMTNEAPAAEAVCKDAATVNLPFIQTVIFPGDDRPLEENTFIIGMQDVAKSRRPWIAEQDTWRRLTPGDAKADVVKKEQPTQPLYSAFTIVGCITYSYRSGNASGQTAFILDVYRACAESPVGQCAFDMSRAHTYEEKDMLVRENRRGLFAK